MTRIVRITCGMAACLMIPLVAGCAGNQTLFRAQSPEPALIQTAAHEEAEETVDLPVPPEPAPVDGEPAPAGPQAAKVPCPPQNAQCPQQGAQCPQHGAQCPQHSHGPYYGEGYYSGGYPYGYCPGSHHGAAVFNNPNGYSAFGYARYTRPNGPPVGDWYPTHIERYYHHPPENLRYPTGPVPNAVIQYPYYTVRGPTDFFMQ